jgi:signal peptidase I
MRPAIEPGDWLLVDPTIVRWPRRGSVVLFREPDGENLAIKRVAAGPGERVRFADGYLELAEDEAWLVSDATSTETAAAGYGEPVDSRRYGPVPVELLLGRAWFRYAPRGRIGRIPASSASGAERLEPFGRG